MLKTFVKFLKFCGKRNKKLFIISLIVSLLFAMFDVIKFACIYIAIDSFLKGTLNNNVILEILGLLGVSIIGMAICKYISTLLQCIAGYTTGANKRIEIAEHLRYMSMGYYNENSLGYITGVTTNAMENFSDVATRVVMMVSDGFLQTIVITLMLFFMDYRIALIVVGVIILFLIIQILHQKEGRKLSPYKDKADNHLIEDVLEFSEGISEVKSYNLVKDAKSKIYSSIEDNKNINTKMEFKFGAFDIFEGGIMKLGTVLICIISTLLYFNGSLPLANTLVIILTSFLIFSGLQRCGSFSSLIKLVDMTIDKANKILESETMNTKGVDYAISKPLIEVNNVSFSYENKEVIKDMSFKILPNTKTAIIGPSGGGKTTMAKLIARFFDVDKGEIKLDGKNIKDYSIDSLMRNFSFVFQNVYLFNDTIKNNLKFGKDDATDEEIVEACKRACCHDFIMSLENGYDTVITEGGNSLSGGEKQRISIARAILKDAPIIILDEATANIDVENESLIINAFKELTKNKTIIMIAHRLKTVRDADQIIVIDSGKIVDLGTHETLSNKEGIYKRFINERSEAIGFKL